MKDVAVVVAVADQPTSAMTELDAIMGSGALRAGDRFFIDSQPKWEQVKTALHGAGLSLQETQAPNAKGTLYVSVDSDRMSRVRCDACSTLMLRNGCQAAFGHWCSGCGRLLHLELCADPGQETVFDVFFTEILDPVTLQQRNHEVRMRLIDYDPALSRIVLAAEPLGSKWYRNDPEPEIAAQRAIIARFLHLLSPVQASHRMTVAEDIGHELLAEPIPAFQFTWPYGWQKTGSGENLNAGGLVNLSPDNRRVLHRSSNVTLLAGRTFDHVDSLFGDSLKSVYLVPAFDNYPLPSSSNLLNQAMDHMGLQAYSLLPDYVKRDGGWAPTRLHYKQLDQLRVFMDAYTSVNMRAWDDAIANSNTQHPSHLLVALARVCSPTARLRMYWNNTAGAYEDADLATAKTWLNCNVPQPSTANIYEDLGAWTQAMAAMHLRGR